MPVSILTVLVFWLSSLASSSEQDRSHSVVVDQCVGQVQVNDHLATVASRRVSEPCSWAFPDADLEEEETGDSEALLSDTSWLGLAFSGRDSISPIQHGREVVLQPMRSMILRC